MEWMGSIFGLLSRAKLETASQLQVSAAVAVKLGNKEGGNCRLMRPKNRKAKAEVQYYV